MSNNNDKSITRLNPELRINEEKVQILDAKEFIIKSENNRYL